MKVLSLFDGISCLRVALGSRAVEYYASEIDKNAIKVSTLNYPDIKRLGSVCDISGFTGVDLLVGGSPCTDLSIAKKEREGLKGDRSKLFYEYVRIWKETKPTWFILENVASMSEKDKEIITSILGVEPIMINAALVSAQSRKRLFWTNIPVKGLPADRGILLKDIIETGEIEDKYYIKNNSMKIKKSNKATDLMQVGHVAETNAQSNRVYSTEGKSATLSALAGGSGAKTGLYELKKKQKENLKSVNGKALCLTATNYKGSQSNGTTLIQVKGMSIRGRDNEGKWENQLEIRNDDKTSAITSTQTSKLALVGRVVGRRTDKDGKRKDGDTTIEYEQRVEVRDDQKSNVISTATKDNIVVEEKSIRRLTPKECERLQSLPDDYTAGISMTARYKALGNAFNVEVIKFILSFIPQ
jgi:DNA (cytosine-5)-methyltransferase 3A